MNTTDLIKISREFLQLVSGELDPHTKNKGVITSTAISATLFTPGHIQFAKYGRGPGKQPPIDNIIKWLEEEGKVDYDDVKSTAFAIAVSIATEGTIGYQQDAPDAMEEAISKYLGDYLQKTSDSVEISLLREMEGIQYFPEEIIFKM